MSVAPQANQPGGGNQNPLALPPPPPSSTPASVAAEIDAEILASTAPLESEAASLAAAQQRAVADIQALFAGILPFSAQSAQRVAGTYQATSAAQQGVFAQAWARMNALQQQRAGEAQALAQQIGAPVPMSTYAPGIGMEMGAFIPDAAGELLKASTMGQAGVQEAEAWAGRVFPLQNVRLQKETTAYYRDQITSIKREIASLKAQKPGMVNRRLRERQLEDYEMKLARAEAAQKRYESKRALDLEAKRLKLEQKRLEQDAAQFTEGLKQDTAKTKAARNADAKNYRLQQQNALKANILAISNALATGQSGTIKVKVVKKDPVTGSTYTEEQEVPAPGAKGVRSPNRMLNLIMAQTGIRKGTPMYRFAVQQTIQVLKTQGVTGIPADPSKWEKWWKQRQKKLQGAGGRGSGSRGGGPYEPRSPREPGDAAPGTTPGSGKGGANKHANYDAVADAKPIGPPDTNGRYVVKVNGQYYIVSPMTETATKVSKKQADQFAAAVRGGG